MSDSHEILAGPVKLRLFADVRSLSRSLDEAYDVAGVPLMLLSRVGEDSDILLDRADCAVILDATAHFCEDLIHADIQYAYEIKHGQPKELVEPGTARMVLVRDPSSHGIILRTYDKYVTSMARHELLTLAQGMCGLLDKIRGPHGRFEQTTIPPLPDHTQLEYDLFDLAPGEDTEDPYEEMLHEAAKSYKTPYVTCTTRSETIQLSESEVLACLRRLVLIAKQDRFLRIPPELQGHPSGQLGGMYDPSRRTMQIGGDWFPLNESVILLGMSLKIINDIYSARRKLEDRASSLKAEAMEKLAQIQQILKDASKEREIDLSELECKLHRRMYEVSEGDSPCDNSCIQWSCFMQTLTKEIEEAWRGA